MPLPVSYEDVRLAAGRIEGRVHRTPVMTSRLLDEACGAKVWLKCENLQRAGSFKIRGATNAIASLTDEERARGVVTHSSGNHAQALALAARGFGIPATVVMPRSAPAVKRAATEAYGARVVTCEDDLVSRETTAASVMEETGATLVHPYDDARVIAGQGTAALELFDQVSTMDLVLAPVGGGGLLSGTAIVASSSDVDVVGCEPFGADDAFRSLRDGERVTAHRPDTVADGLLTTLGERNFVILSGLGVPVVRVTEVEIVAAMRFIWERCKLVIEPSSAVPVAALMHGHVDAKGKDVGLILSGGNVDAGILFRHLADEAARRDASRSS